MYKIHKEISYKKNQIVCNFEDVSDKIYLIKEGNFRVIIFFILEN